MSDDVEAVGQGGAEQQARKRLGTLALAVRPVLAVDAGGGHRGAALHARYPAKGRDLTDGGRPGGRDVLDHDGRRALSGARLRGVRRPGARPTRRRGPGHVAALEAADLIYLSGGNPGYLVDTLRDSAVWAAIVRVWERGGTLAGSSAGAMALGRWTLARDGNAPRGMLSHWKPALDLIGAIGVIPHYDRFGPARTLPRVEDAPPGMVVLGIDEDTVVLRDGAGARVLGRGTVTLWHDGRAHDSAVRRRYPAGSPAPALTHLSLTRLPVCQGTKTTLIGSPSRSATTRKPSWIWSSGKRWVTSSPQRSLPCAQRESARLTAAAPSPRVV